MINQNKPPSDAQRFLQNVSARRSMSVFENQSAPQTQTQSPEEMAAIQAIRREGQRKDLKRLLKMRLHDELANTRVHLEYQLSKTEDMINQTTIVKQHISQHLKGQAISELEERLQRLKQMPVYDDIKDAIDSIRIK
ncbi:MULTISPECIES: hypothetical protein [Bacillus]|jgi:hypothetical protein|uniref:hypothetical protein n=1 Tax=Bacillus TaxID=1386 RepID=UPI000760EBB2|nr:MULTISPECIES: hypothetical protein [Bacillus]AOC58145.1 hypothetical protein BEN31_15840 [Bacillus pumilus]AZV54311.1 hypothetical protein DKE43_14860 [Bacillus pumilus]MBR0588456.1 hypothetical protein [Bacillus pumilus DW2J2]MBR0618101.1 hypothetical protein [Bacillus pumilus]MBR0622562.1 hypothetical protein [Bacillus pumilus]